MTTQDFALTDDIYLLNHSVGRPLKSTEHAVHDAFFSPWQDSGREPWAQWLPIIDRFQNALADLFDSDTDLFCPQVNLSSALTKLLMAHPRLSDAPTVLLTEQDFPSMGFALQRALPANTNFRFIPATTDLTDPAQWDAYLQSDVDLVFLSHAYSNTGQRCPIETLVPNAKSLGILTLVDVAQSAGVLPLSLKELKPDFLIGSSVKWLCSGPGAAYLWVNRDQLANCEPKDVGWFSHENPFEFDIHHFAYHDSALRFWGGTPSILPYAVAAHSIRYFADLDRTQLHNHNQHLLDYMAEQLPDWVVSPTDTQQRSGTAILHNAGKTDQALSALTQANISVDQRARGLRVSPHLYNSSEDIDRLITVLKAL